MSGEKAEKTNAVEMLSFGGLQFAASIFMAFSSYYLMMFFTDVALIPPAATAVLLLCFRLFSAVDTQVIGIFINRNHFKDGKYRPYFKWCALPFAAGLVALGLTPGIGASGRIVYAVFTLIICDLSWSLLHTASLSMLPYMARDDINRTKFMSFSNGSSILAYILVGTFMLPAAGFLGAGDTSRGFGLTLVLLAVIIAPLVFNAYYRLKERHYVEPEEKPAVRDVFLAIIHSRRIMLFLAGLCLYFMADAFKNQTTYYYMTFVMGRPDLLPVIIMAGLVTPLAMQPVIPRLLKYAEKERLIIFGLFAASCSCFMMLAAGNRPFALIVCVVLYGVFTAIIANLIFAVMASFSDEIRMQQQISMSEILAAIMNLGSNLGAAVAGGVAATAMAAFGYSAQAASQTTAALAAIKTLYILCTATGMLLSAVVFLSLRHSNTTADSG